MCIRDRPARRAPPAPLNPSTTTYRTSATAPFAASQPRREKGGPSPVGTVPMRPASGTTGIDAAPRQAARAVDR
eukprot:6599700-Alexandrium_andersonii.AAC.1